MKGEKQRRNCTGNDATTGEGVRSEDVGGGAPVLFHVRQSASGSLEICTKSTRPCILDETSISPTPH